jgi:hypothetical protein
MYVLLAIFALWFVYRLVKTKGGTVSDSKTTKKNGRSHESIYMWPKLDEYDFPVVGESHYQSALARIAGHHGSNKVRQECIANLVPEDTNEFDDKAIAVVVDSSTVGYLARDDARSFRRRLSQNGLAGQTTGCHAIVIGGGNLPNGDGRSYGIQLDLDCFE